MTTKKKIGNLVGGFISILLGMEIESRKRLKKEIKDMTYDQKIDYLLKRGHHEAYYDVLVNLGKDKRKNKKLRKFLQERLL